MTGKVIDAGIKDDDAEAAHWREEARRLQMILRKEARDAKLERHLIARFGRKE